MSTSTNSFNGDGTVPGWMKAVDQDMAYDAPRPDATEQATQPPPPSTEIQKDRPREAEPHAEASSLDQKLALSMAAPSELPEPDPSLQPVSVGSVRADLSRQLEKAVSVLGSRYATTVSRSLLLEFALQRILLELRTEGAESALVQWLDSVLPQH
ncbi:hypothetical protein [Salinibacter grassmerensis]|uniref:hypothetical protein n=1 Tax=Salinibacter grassmerensis TaxID=3040353 RepID=UPI0021E98C62|nr:hypothetical protein [Salinibacter grassmerensis]